VVPARTVQLSHSPRRRGVEVDILTSGESIDQNLVKHASFNRWGPLLEAGIRIHDFKPSMYHSKLLVVDEYWSSIGSANLDNRSFRINDETNVNVFDAEFSSTLAATFDADLANAQLWTMERWLQRPWHQRVRGWLARLIGAHL